MPLTESPSEGRLVDIGDTRLFVVEKSQEGYPLICLHALRRDHWTFADYLDGLAPEIRVVLPDLRGHGMSDAADEVTERELAEDVGALADALELERYALLAHGDAAIVATAHAAAHARRVTHMIDVGPAANASHSIADEELAAQYARRTAPAVERPELRVHRDVGDVTVEGVPSIVFDSKYAFVEDQERFVESVRSFVLKGSE